MGLVRLAVADPALDLLRGLPLHGAGDVAVDIDGSRRGDMSDDGGERFHVHTVLQRGGGEGMAQVVEADVLALRPHQYFFHLSIDALRIQRSVFFYRRGKHPAGIRPLLQLPQHGQHRRRQDHHPVRAFRLRRRYMQRTRHMNDLPLDVELAGAQIQIVPLQGADLAPPHAGRQLQQHHLVEAVLLRLDQKPLHLLVGEHLHLPRLLRRQLAADGGIHADQPLGLRLLQRDPAGGVAGTHHAVGQAGAVKITTDTPPVPFQLRVELLEITLRQLAERDFSNARDDVIVDPILVALLCRDPQAGLGPGLVPQVDPLAEGHVRLCSAGDNTALHFEFFQLFLTDRL